MSIEDAWAAGLFEGEGCIAFGGKDGRYPQLALATVDRDVAERFTRVVGTGNVYEAKRRTVRGKRVYTWRLGAAREVEAVLQRLLPYLGARRAARAQEALARLSLVAQPQTVCKRGHDAWVTYADGKRRCRTCRKAERQQRRAAQRRG